MKQIIPAIFVSLVILVSAAQAEPLPVYTPGQLPADSLTSVGSDSMGGLVDLWVEAYKEHQPRVKVQVVSRGSATAPAALIEGSADLGPMARPMKSAERSKFIAAYGFEPTQIRTALAAVSIYVSKENPINEISVRDLESLFVADSSEKTTWKQFSVKGAVGKKPVLLFGQSSHPYIAGYFKQRVLQQKPFADSLMGTADYGSLFQAISMNSNGIGYGEVRSTTDTGVKVLAVRKSPDEPAFLPTEANIVAGNYPLSRSLNIYVVRTPGEPLDVALRDFLTFVLSEQGQQIVRAQGLIPMPAAAIAKELTKLQ